MKTALFRADGSHQLGLGHIMRCLALSHRLRQFEIFPLFVIRDYEPQIAGLLKSEKSGIIKIPPDISLPEDASLTLKNASLGDIRMIVTDLGNSKNMADIDGYRKYFQVLKDARKFMIIFDELIQENFPRGLQVIPYYGAEDNCPDSRTGMKLLLGTDYFIFREEFIAAASKRRQIKKEAGNILITMGGSDPAGLTLRVARVLKKLDKESLKLRFVIGSGYKGSTRTELESIVGGYRGGWEIIDGGDSLADLMRWADLGIIAGGLTKYEMAVTGTPCVIISHSEYEAGMSEKFSKGGSALHLGSAGRVNDSNISRAVAGLLADYGLRDEMSRKGRKIVDGKGIDRVISNIPQEVLL